jgi:hypothetical protein
MGIMQSTMGEYSSSYFGISIMDVFHFFWRGRFGKIEKFNALKAARPEVAADTEDTMEFAVEEETAS